MINKDGRYQIAEKALIFVQEFSNKIHHHFEILHGGFDMPAKFYLDSPMPVRGAILGLNHCVHDLETLAKNVKYAGTEYELYVFSGIMLEIHNCYRTFIPGSFYKYFTLNLDFGDMVIHYSQIGKTWLEAFYDEDKDVFDSGIRPHYALSGEFDILFGKLTPDQKHLENLKAFLEARGKDINDPNLRLGHLPVAKLAIGEENFKSVKEEVGKRSRIKRVVAMNDGKVSAKRVFILLDDTLPV